MEFRYTVKSKDNKIREGKLSATNKSDAKIFLRKRGFRILSLIPDQSSKLLEGENGILGEFLIRNAKGEYEFLLGDQGPTSKEIIIFTKQLATMVASGVTLIRSLSVLERQQRARGFRIAIAAIRDKVEKGSTFSAALAAYPHMFDSLYVAMVEAGEVSGNLDTILKKLVQYSERAEKIKSQVKSAMAYPVIVILVAIIVVSALLIFVVPAFAQQFSESGRELPGLTQFVIDMSDFFVQNWYLIFGGAIVSIFGLHYWRQTPAGRFVFDKYILKSPLIGNVLQKIAIGRFCSTMSSMLSSGVNLLQALSICAASSGNKVIESFILNVRASLERGENFSTPLSEGTLFPQMVISMVEVGESTGSLEDMLTKISDLYEEEVDVAVKTMLSMIEPIMLVVIGGMVAFIVIAMYLPIFDMAGGV